MTKITFEITKENKEFLEKFPEEKHDKIINFAIQEYRKLGVI